jgi:hypothetical protein
MKSYRWIVAGIATCFSMNSTLGAHANLVTGLCEAALTMHQALKPRRTREVVAEHWQHQPVMVLGFPS